MQQASHRVSTFEYLRPRVPGWAYLEGKVCLCVCLYGMQFYLGSSRVLPVAVPCDASRRNSTVQAIHFEYLFLDVPA